MVTSISAWDIGLFAGIGFGGFGTLWVRSIAGGGWIGSPSLLMAS